MYEDFFAERLSALRGEKNVSAREMSLAIGQNESYINRIENKHAFPSMQCFFYICEYLEISPKDFFDMDAPHPVKLNAVIEELRKLDNAQLDVISAVAREMQHKPGGMVGSK